MHLPRPVLIATLGLLLTPGAALARPDRIVGGSDTEIAAVPYQAALLDTSVDGDTGDSLNEQVCGATILDATHLVTAGHCMFEEDSGDREPDANFEVLVGATDLSEGDTSSGQTLELPVQKLALAATDGATVNPDYDPDTMENDTTLLTLATPLVFSAAVQPIGGLVASKPTTGPTLVSGWGCTTQNDSDDATACTMGSEYPDDLMDATVDVVSDSTCASEYNDTTQTSFFPDAMLCAADTGKDTCPGDSGGPDVVVGTTGDFSSYELAGVTSFGAGCADPSFAGVYANVADSTVSSVLARPAVATSPKAIAPASVSQAGGIVTCDPGEWTGSPTFMYEFDDGAGVLQSASGLTTYARTAADTGQTITCTVTGTTPVASASIKSGDPIPTGPSGSSGPTGPTGPTGSSGPNGPPATTTGTTTTPPPSTTIGTTTTTPPPTTTTTPGTTTDVTTTGPVVTSAGTPATPPPASDGTIPPLAPPLTPTTLVPPTVKDTTPPALALAARRLRVSRRGTFKLTVGAPGEAARTTAKLSLSRKLKGRKTISLGAKSATASSPTSPTVLAFKLKAPTAKLLNQKGKLKVSVVLSSTDAAGNVATKLTTVTLVA